MKTNGATEQERKDSEAMKKEVEDWKRKYKELEMQHNILTAKYAKLETETSSLREVFNFFLHQYFSNSKQQEKAARIFANKV